MIRVLCRLFRLRLVLMNGFVAVGGFLLYPGTADTLRLCALFCGVALLAAGGSALNQVLEIDLDRVMTRTRLRPLPNGDLSLAAVTVIGTICSLAGFVLLLAVGGPIPALLGIAALAWYLAIYTPLKRRTPFALIMGGVCGALPPVIGWSMAGGSPADHWVIMLSAVMFLWQVPHFWLFQRRYANDYRRAGIPLLEVSSRGAQHHGLFGLWICALITSVMLLPTFGIINGSISLWYALFPIPLIAISMFNSETALFSYLNIFPLMLTIALIAQR
ncbi:MAG: protoheme IX farnesyltransferase [Geobacter sp.]|nr:MAG: protoheme IX farnesyltransferase [Geobacter sp.]